MNNIHSYTTHCCYPVSAALETMWYVDTDSSYQIYFHKRSLFSSMCLAVRTINGTGQMVLRDHTIYTLDPESLMLVCGKDIQSYGCQGERWNFCWFEFHMDENFFSKLCGLHTIGIEDGEVQEMEKIFGILNQADPYTARTASSRFSTLLTSWVSHMERESETEDSPVLPALRFIQMNFDREISLDALSVLCHMSERSFRQHFTQETGISPKKYLIDRRMNAARDLLLYTSMPVCAIASSVGFDSPFYFSKCFRKFFGMPPVVYRKQFRTD